MVFNFKKKTPAKAQPIFDTKHKWDSDLLRRFFIGTRSYPMFPSSICSFDQNGFLIKEAKQYQAFEHTIFIGGFQQSIYTSKIKLESYGYMHLREDIIYDYKIGKWIQSNIEIEQDIESSIAMLSPGTGNPCVGQAYLGPYNLPDRNDAATLEIKLWLPKVIVENIKEIFQMHKADNTMPELGIRLLVPVPDELVSNMSESREIKGTSFYIERIWLEGKTTFNQRDVCKNLRYRTDL